MPFVARDKETQETVLIWNYKRPRIELANRKFVCPLCASDMFVRHPARARAHFFHSVECQSEYKYHPESPEHMEGKYYLVNSELPRWSDYQNARFEIERLIPEIKRRADVYVEFSEEHVEINEVQLSSITIDELEKRTQDYESLGYDVRWWFGGLADNKNSRGWSMDRYGEYFFLKFKKWPQEIPASEYGRGKT